MRTLLYTVSISAVILAAIYSFSSYNLPNSKTEEGESYRESLEYDFIRFRNPFTNAIPYKIREKELAFAATLPKRNESSRATSWQNIGPYNLGGRTRALALDVTNENIILVGQVTGGVWKSIDGGASFAKTTQPQQMQSVTCLAQDKRAGKTNIWYQGTGEEYGVVNAAGFSSQYSGNGIFKSTDGGNSWSPLISTQSNTPTTLANKRDMDFVWEIVTDASNTTQDEVYAATVNGIWRSIDGGVVWSPVLGLDTAASSISIYTDLAITDAGVLYATVSSETASRGIWRSTDGIQWENITPTGFPATYNRIEIGIAPSNQDLLYFIAETPNSGTTGHNLWKYNYLSGNGAGANGKWTNRTANIPDESCLGFFNFDFRKFNSQSSYDLYVAIHPTDTNTIFIGGTNVFRSTDGFATDAYTWIGGYQCDTSNLYNYVFPNHHPDQHKLIFYPSDPNKALSGSDGGVRRAQNILAEPMIWEDLSNGYITGQFYTCALEPGETNNPIVMGGLQDNGTYFTGSTNPQNPWVSVARGDGSYCAMTHERKSYYVSWQTGKMFKAQISDVGVVDSFSRIDPTGGSGYSFINPFIMDPLVDSAMYLSAGRWIWKNENLNGIPYTFNIANTINTNWKRFTGLGLSGITSGNISCLEMSANNNDRLYFGTSQGQIYRTDSVLAGANPQKVLLSSPLFPPNAYVSSLSVDKLDYRKVLATFSNYGVRSIFYSADGGDTWSDVSGNLEQNTDGTGDGPSVTWGHIFNDGASSKFYVGTSVGLFSTDVLNGTATIWVQEGAQTIGNLVINMISSRAFDGKIIVATHGNGMYTNKMNTGISTLGKKENITAFPNPFSNSVEINFGATFNGKIIIYDLVGKAVFEKQLAQSSSFIWDGKDLHSREVSAGNYIATFSTAKETRSIKIFKK